MTGIDDVHAQLVSGAELVVLDVRGDEGIAAGPVGIHHIRGAGTAAHGDHAHRLAAIHKSNTVGAKRLLNKARKFCKALEKSNPRRYA